MTTSEPMGAEQKQALAERNRARIAEMAAGSPHAAEAHRARHEAHADTPRLP